MTRQEFDRYPLLLGAREMMEVMGFNKDALKRFRREHPEVVSTASTTKRVRYVKARVAGFVGLGG